MKYLSFKNELPWLYRNLCGVIDSRPEWSLDLGRTGEDLDEDSDVEVDARGEERHDVALVAVGVGLQTWQEDAYTLGEWEGGREGGM